MKAAWLAGLAALPMALAAPAEAQFGPPFAISAPSKTLMNLDVAMDADGDAVVVWVHTPLAGGYKRIHARSRSKAGALGPILSLSEDGRNAANPQVAMNPDGHAVVVWRGYEPRDGTWRIEGRVRAANGRLSPIHTLSQANASNPQVAVDADGDPVFIWQRGERIEARRGFLGSITTLSQAGASSAQVAVDADGDAVIVWKQCGLPDCRAQARTLSKAGVLGPTLTLHEAGHAERPQVAMSADGNALVVWDVSGPSVQARTLSKEGVLGPILTLNLLGHNASFAQVAMDADGDAVVVWTDHDGTDRRIQGRTWSKTGVIGSVRTFSQAGARYPRVAVDADRDAVVVWERNEEGEWNLRAEARRWPRRGLLSPIRTLSAPGEYHASGVHVALDADGSALATWSQYDGTTYRAFGTATP